MTSIAINTKYVSIPELKLKGALNIGYKGEFFIKSKNEDLPINTDDNLILIKPIKDDLIFTNSAVINKVEKPIFIKKNNILSNSSNSFENIDYYEHYFRFEVKKILDENNKLSELEYSLPIIYNYNNPEAHFQSQYRKIERSDFETIINGWVYATRTVFGKLINALPRQNKLEFMILAIDNFSIIDFRNISLLEGLQFLHKYIERRVMSRGKLLVASNKILKNQLDTLPYLDKIGFIDPGTNKIQNINSQAEIFSKLFLLEKEKSIENALKETINKNGELEERFQNLFKRYNWPINLEK